MYRSCSSHRYSSYGAFARAILDVLNKHLQNSMDIGIAQSALIQVTTYLGYFLMAIPAGIYINKRKPPQRRGVGSVPLQRRP